MIRVKLEYTSGTTEEKQFSNNLEMFDYIKTNGPIWKLKVPKDSPDQGLKDGFDNYHNK